MYCRHCGTLNDDNAYKCIKCGEIVQDIRQTDQAGGQQPPPPPPPPHMRPQGQRRPISPQTPNYLPQAILVTLFCCLPFGIVAIIHASQVSGKVSSGDLEGARESGDKAKFWCWVSFGTGLVGMILYFMLMVISAIMGGTH